MHDLLKEVDTQLHSYELQRRFPSWELDSSKYDVNSNVPLLVNTNDMIRLYQVTTYHGLDIPTIHQCDFHLVLHEVQGQLSFLLIL
jgi:hypothetical protein